MDAVAPPIRAALELFETALAEVRFADLDAKTLARSAADVEAVAAVVTSAQAALDSARCALQERQEILLDQVQRAVAYARVYAENDDALTERLQAIALPRTPRSGRTKDDAALVLSSTTQSSPRPRSGRRKPTTAGPMLVVDRPDESSNEKIGETNDSEGGLAVASRY
jgi:hypothetical protein